MKIVIVLHFYGSRTIWSYDTCLQNEDPRPHEFLTRLTSWSCKQTSYMLYWHSSLQDIVVVPYLIFLYLSVHSTFLSLLSCFTLSLSVSMTMFSTFEHSIDFIYDNVIQKKKEDCSVAQQLGVTCLAGYAAGAFGTLISNPADNIVSSLYNKNAENVLQVVLLNEVFRWSNPSTLSKGYNCIHSDIFFFRLWRILGLLICLLGVFLFELHLWGLLWHCSGSFTTPLKF